MRTLHSTSIQYIREIYSLACFCAFLRIGSILVAFITSPLIFSFPDMNSFCAFALPEISLAKSTSESMSVTIHRALSAFRKCLGLYSIISCIRPFVDVWCTHTSWLLPLRRRPLAYLAALFEIDVPVARLALVVLQRECEDGTALLDRVLALGFVGEGVGDEIEGCGRGPGVWIKPLSDYHHSLWSSRLAFFERHVGFVAGVFVFLVIEF